MKYSARIWSQNPTLNSYSKNPQTEAYTLLFVISKLIAKIKTIYTLF